MLAKEDTKSRKQQEWDQEKKEKEAEAATKTVKAAKEKVAKKEQQQQAQKRSTSTRDRKKKKNVLFVMTDDLRPSLSIYDKPVITPAFERLAKGGVVFERAYNQDPICNPSRNSMLSGRRPDTTRVWLFEHTVPHKYSNIFKYFKEEGKYNVYGTGKLWHWTSTWLDDFKNEYFPPTTDAWNQGTDENYPLMNASVQPDKIWPEERYWDYKIATEGLKLMEEAANDKTNEEPFFLAVGFHQPHRPWHMPQKYWDLYDDVVVPVTPHTTWPIDAPTIATGDINPGEIGMLPNSEKRYWPTPKGEVGADAIRENVRGYHASISFLDHQLQRLLDGLEEHKLVDDTIVVFCVDHGMNIGDHGMWDKRTLFETNARVPLIIRDPDFPETFGSNASALVENVDIFPTLIEMAGLPDPKDILFPPLEGKSLVPLLKDPKKGSVKDFAMTQIARCCNNGCGKENVEDVDWRKWEVCRGGNWEWHEYNERVYMGYSLRMDDWRYTIWVPFDSQTHSPQWELPLGGEELYDHRDPRCNEKGNFDLCETRNVIKDESLREIRDELYAKVRSIVDSYNLNAWEQEREERRKESEGQAGEAEKKEE
jgi:iduronate 2-sulfatase